jgi:hypothetical protein
MAGFCVVTEIYHASPARNPSFMQQRLAKPLQNIMKLGTVMAMPM